MMSDQMAGFGVLSWLPPAVARRIEAEQRHEERLSRQAEQEREEARERHADAALAAYRAGAEQRGEVVSAMSLARGEDVGRGVDDIFADARAAADREDARDAARQRREAGGEVFFGEPVIRSWFPSSEYELDSELQRASDLHRDLVAYRARRDYPAALEAARSQSSRGEAARSADHPGYYEVTRGVEGAIGDVW
jgi:hypothetical protein